MTSFLAERLVGPALDKPVLPLSSSLGLDRCQTHIGGACNWRMAATYDLIRVRSNVAFTGPMLRAILAAIRSLRPPPLCT